MSTMQRVRAAISLSHDTIEQTDFAKSLMDGRITRSGYGLYLAQIWHIHNTLEQTIPALPNVAGYFQPAMMRTAAIARDAEAIGYPILSQFKLPTTVAIEHEMLGWSQTAPLAMLGCVYILEGSRMGSLMIAKPLAIALGVGATQVAGSIAGVEYHMDGAAETPRRVRQFKAAIDAAELSDQAEAELTFGACSFMQMLLSLYECLPVSATQTQATSAQCPFMRTHVATTQQLRTA